jgi:hypothetical protein
MKRRKENGGNERKMKEKRETERRKGEFIEGYKLCQSTIVSLFPLIFLFAHNCP